MSNIIGAIENTVPISLFNRGLAGKIFAEVKQGTAKVVMKNNAAECVLMAPDEYVRLMNEVNDARLLSSAVQRMSHFDPASTISIEEIDRKYGITPEMLEKYRKIQLLANYVDETEKVVEEYNKEHDIDNSVLVNGRRQTNLGVFRAYLTNYLRSLPTVNQDMTCMVRQLQPTETGIPLELYFFSANKVWVAYEGIQADVFDHVLAIIPEFGLRVFQNPSGEDLRRIGVKIEH